MSLELISLVSLGIGFVLGFILASLLAMDDGLEAEYSDWRPPARDLLQRYQLRLNKYRRAMVGLVVLLASISIGWGMAVWH